MLEVLKQVASLVALVAAFMALGAALHRWQTRRREDASGSWVGFNHGGPLEVSERNEHRDHARQGDAHHPGGGASDGGGHGGGDGGGRASDGGG